MLIRATKCKFGPLEEWFVNQKVQLEVTTKTEKTIDERDQIVKRGVLAGLDNSYNRDYTIPHVGDPILAVHSELGVTHDELKERLLDFDLWCQTFHPIELPRKDEDGNPDWICGFKTTPEGVNKLDRFKSTLSEKSNGLDLESKTDIEVTVPDKQRKIWQF